MSIVKNIDPIERKVHILFHCLAVKYDVDVDKVAEIIKDWVEWEERNFLTTQDRQNRRGNEKKKGSYHRTTSTEVS